MNLYFRDGPDSTAPLRSRVECGICRNRRLASSTPGARNTIMDGPPLAEDQVNGAIPVARSRRRPSPSAFFAKSASTACWSSPFSDKKPQTAPAASPRTTTKPQGPALPLLVGAICPSHPPTDSKMTDRPSDRRGPPRPPARCDIVAGGLTLCSPLCSAETTLGRHFDTVFSRFRLRPSRAVRSSGADNDPNRASRT